LRPGETRWNSFHNALKDVLKIREKNIELCTALNLHRSFSTSDFTYIDEFVRCTDPLAKALNILQEEQYAYFGITVPTVIGLRRHLQKLTETTFEFCGPISESLLSSVCTRFEEFLNFSTTASSNAGVATLSHPEFKKKWFSCIPETSQYKVLGAFQDAVLSVTRQHATADPTPQPTESVSNPEANFFDFGPNSTTSDHISSAVTCAELEVAQFFTDSNPDLTMLNNYLNVKAVFLRYNTPLPSSGPVERLFSYATITDMPKANRLSDKNFEKRVVLKANSSFSTSA
jgi:hypothetical protein